MNDFGVILACYNKDYSFAKGCCASIRYFLGDVPICLIIDGTFPVQELEKTYGVQPLYRADVVTKELREKSFGWGYTKMVAFWESPWKHFLYVDADTVVWGDVLKFANFKDFDIIIDRPCYEYSEEAMSQWFFDVNRINTYYPDFRWQNCPFACAGVMFGTRGIFSLDEYVELLELQAAEPKLFYPGDQGLWNLMVFRGADEGRIRLGQEDIQLLVPDFPQEELKKRFPVDKNGPVANNEATVIHWCGTKPFLSRTKVYAEPMNFFRRKFLRDALNSTGLAADVALQVEDFNAYKTKISRWLTNQAKQLIQSQ